MVKSVSPSPYKRIEMVAHWPTISPVSKSKTDTAALEVPDLS